MGSHFYDNEFEEFLKEQSDQFRMYPSDHVWRSIQKEVHGPVKWPALTVVAIMIIAALVVGTVAVKKDVQLTVTPGKQQASTIAQALTATAPVAKTQAIISDNLSVERLTNKAIALAEQAVRETVISGDIEIVEDYSGVVAAGAEVQLHVTTPAVLATLQEPALITHRDEPVKEKATTRPNVYSAVASEFVSSSMLRDFGQPASFRPQSEFNYTFPYSQYYERSGNYTTQLNFAVEHADKETKLRSPLKKLGSAKSKYDFQFYLTPSASYRRLVDNEEGTLTKSYITALPLAQNYVIDLNQVINHRPATGFEVGFSLGYNLNRNFAVRSGLQFNIQQYNIDAFVHSNEQTTIALTSGNSNELVNTVSGFRSISGSVPITLKNRYYQISIPIGVDWRPINKKFAWGIAAAIQPTYTFDKEPFIITSNFKNYADGSELMRNFNINANIETYLGYNTGKYRWQIGPQIRYQVLPTMASSYPIREYMIDYGIKVGLVRSLQ